MRNCPRGTYPAPVTRYRWLPVTISRTVISFRVKVPVLSEQITVTEPRVSTLGSLRTRALRRAMRWRPSASATVTTAGRPSGTAATARPTASRNASMIRSPRSVWSVKMSAVAIKQTTTSTRPSSASRRCRGVGSADCPLQQAGNPPQLGRHAGRDDGRVPLAGGDHGARVDHVPAIAQGGGRVQDAGGVFLHGRGLAGERRLLHAEAEALDEPGVGRYAAACFQVDDVARDQIARRDDLQPAAASHPGHRGREPS